MSTSTGPTPIMLQILEQFEEIKAGALSGRIKALTVVTTDAQNNGVYATAFTDVDDASKHSSALESAARRTRELVAQYQGNAPPNNRSAERH